MNSVTWNPLRWLHLLLVFFAAHPCGALERANLLFYLPFEGNLTPAISRGSTEIKSDEFVFPVKGSFKESADAATAATGKEEKGVTFVSGRKGLGLRVSEDLTRSKVYSYPCLQYLAGDSFSRREGTLSAWIKPVGWGKGGRNHRYFLAATADNCVIRFYIYGFNTYAWVDGAEKYVLVGGNKWNGWQDDTWAFLAFTYKPGQQSFYINGQAMSVMTDGLIEPEFSHRGMLEISEGSHVVDEVMLFDRVLSANEIQAIYKANLP